MTSDGDLKGRPDTIPVKFEIYWASSRRLGDALWEPRVRHAWRPLKVSNGHPF